MMLTLLIALTSAVTIAKYNLEESSSLARYSFLSYCSAEKLESWTCGDCSKLPHFGEVTVIHNPKT